MNEHIWDPLRRKNVALTPEEQVRQWFIQILINEAKVPVHQMNSEVALKFGAKQYRADILIYREGTLPLAIVECKRPSVALSQDVVDQALRYNLILSVPLLILTNGTSTLLFALNANTKTYQQLHHLPNYEEMVEF